MDNFPLVSIIVLTYNKFSNINENLESIFSQDYENIELIISDDCSTNFPYERVKEKTRNRPPNVKNIIIRNNNENIGIVKNYNTAIKASSGKYIIPLSIDDIFYKNDVVSSIVQFFQKENLLIITGLRNVFTEDMTESLYILPCDEDIDILIKSPLETYKRLCINNFISGSCTSFSRMLFEKYGWFDEKYLLLEDYPKYLSLTRQGVKIGFLRKIVIKYSIGGVSYSPNNKLVLDHIKVFENEILNYKNIFSKKEFESLKSHYLAIKTKYSLKNRTYFRLLILFFNPEYFFLLCKKIGRFFLKSHF
jgi:GT2 family glycosyltransferase